MNTTGITALRDSAAAVVRDLDMDAISAAAEVLAEVRLSQGIVLTAGNGGSSSTASHFAADLVKYTRSPQQPHFRALSLTDNIACHTAWTNDADPALAMAYLAEPWLPTGAKDAAVLFSVHGGARDGSVSTNLVELARFVHKTGGKVIAVTGFDGGAIGDISDVHINVPLDREPVATPGVESVHLLVAHALCLLLSGKEPS
ncbi:D-sedoheptulose 7-phosphate isomerase [Allocatelliglobosispora scoriae]|uniref:D-sedoheptulose 7-phosphate isomerase n=1 Tax=Allocatelliglobosispora scoriae TaxID=643052 RepID=A0A841BMA8_9ACTN|nr:SIS domain-containing protein [Allocatelliglobosispora scoriae]MBB5868329.1 D-sedoheptulose 7-phosphate isomerase [Allocatelliglobosispora scoriae]